MLDRLLSFFGFGGYLPTFGGGADAPAVPGEAAFDFTPGRRTEDVLEESRDERRERITDDDLVWPGKDTTIGVRNDENTVFRYTLTLTDLDPALYTVYPPEGGQRHPLGGVLLQPGEEAAFDISFAPPPLDFRSRSGTFSFVITRFDPRRSGDAGVILGDLAARWVSLAEVNQVQIAARPPEIVTRPWRRAARLDLILQNASLLPPSVTLRVLRAPTRDGLTQNPDPAGTLERAMEARTGGVWRCLLPPTEPPATYFATVAGTVRVADDAERRLALRQPVLIRYIPWLRRGRDWAALLGGLLLLVWLVAGLPVWKTPVVVVPLQFSGLGDALPQDATLKDVTVTLTPTDAHGEPSGEPLPGEVVGDRLEFTLPGRLYWVRWPFGRRLVWNGFSRAPSYFQLSVKAREGQEYLFHAYDLDDAAPSGGETPAVSVASAPTVVGPWTSVIPLTVPRNKAVLVDVSLGRLGVFTHRDPQQITLTYALTGQDPVTHSYPLVHDPTTGRLLPVRLDLTGAVPLGTEPYLTVQGQIATVAADPVAPIQLRHRESAFPCVLTFPDTLPLAPAGGGQANIQEVPPVGPPPPSPGQVPGAAAGGAGGGPTGGATSGPGGTPVPPPTPGAGTAQAAHEAALQQHLLHLQQQQAAQQAALQQHQQHQKAQQAAAAKKAQLTAELKAERDAQLKPAAPVSVIATPASQSQINVYWLPCRGADSYSVYRCQLPGTLPPNWVLLNTVPHINYADKSVQRGTMYQYQVISNNASGTSSPTESAAATAPEH